MTEPSNLDEAIEVVDSDERSSLREKMWLIIVSVLLFIATGVIGVLAWQLSIDRNQAKTEAASATQEKQEIAQEVQAVICTADDIHVYDETLCERLELAAVGAGTGERGPQGPAGPAGRDGRDGPTGPQGPAGRDGDDSAVPGPPGLSGLNGANGADSTVPGPQGPTGPTGPAGKDGADGTNGTNGRDGRGISSVTCEGTGDNSYWVVTYTDGTNQTSTGPCRLTELTLPTEGP